MLQERKKLKQQGQNHGLLVWDLATILVLTLQPAQRIISAIIPDKKMNAFPLDLDNKQADASSPTSQNSLLFWIFSSF